MCVRDKHLTSTDGLLERPTADACGKGGPRMANTSPPPIRKELQECFRHCERLLASALVSDNPPFSQEERAMMKYFADEIAKISVSQDITRKLTSESDGNSRTTGGHTMGSQEASLQRQWEHHAWGWWNVGTR